jgi:hypothetical protein
LTATGRLGIGSPVEEWTNASPALGGMGNIPLSW